MKNREMTLRFDILVILLVFVISHGILFTQNSKVSLSIEENKTDYLLDNEIRNLHRSSIEEVKSNWDLLQEELTSKFNHYNNKGYFPAIYRPSISATYYALYILYATGREDKLSLTQALEFIMSNYNDTANLFSDDYSRRYLDCTNYLDLDKVSCRTSLLITNC
ncbi:MAG: hypothetical protein GF311_10695 [Candidatus Lokiarchaeota archaeon]|nr:hypothetical protein [Candidatus Lokiarchaeota archaeon]